MTSWQGLQVTCRGLLGVAATAPLGGCGLFDPDVWTHRTRLTLSINTPSGPLQGSTVVEAQSAVGWRPGVQTRLAVLKTRDRLLKGGVRIKSVMTCRGSNRRWMTHHWQFSMVISGSARR
jgi:hypothetical protein